MLEQNQPSSKGAGHGAAAAAFEILTMIGTIFERSAALRAPVNPAMKAEASEAEAATILAYIARNLDYDATIERYRWKTESVKRRAGEFAGTVRTGYILIDGKTYSPATLHFIECAGNLPGRGKVQSIVGMGRPQLNPAKDSTTGILGVYFDARNKQFGVWVAKQYYGHFDNLDEAASVAEAARRKVYGNIAGPPAQTRQAGPFQAPIPRCRYGARPNRLCARMG